MALTLNISTNKKEYRPGESILAEMVLENNSSSAETVPEFTFNSDNTSIIVLNAEKRAIATVDDYTLQLRLGYDMTERIDAPADELKPGMKRRTVWDLTSYIRILKKGMYSLHARFKYPGDEILSEPCEFEILDGDARGLNHAWHMRRGARKFCHLVYYDSKELFNMKGYGNNPEVTKYNLPLKSEYLSERIVPSRSCYDGDDYQLRLVGMNKKDLIGIAVEKDEIKSDLEVVKLSGDVAFDGVYETCKQDLIVPEVFIQDGSGRLRFHVFDKSGKKTAEKTIDVGADCEVYDARAYRGGEYLLVYCEGKGKGNDIYSAFATKPDLSDLKQTRLLGSSKNFSDALLPPGTKMPKEFYAVAFDPEPKELMIYTVNLDPDIKTNAPPKQILETKGALQYLDFAMEKNGAMYLLFIEDDHKLLFYNQSLNEFRMITGDKFDDAQLIITERHGVFAAYIDKDRLVRFKHLEFKAEVH